MDSSNISRVVNCNLCDPYAWLHWKAQRKQHSDWHEQNYERSELSGIWKNCSWSVIEEINFLALKKKERGLFGSKLNKAASLLVVSHVIGKTRSWMCNFRSHGNKLQCVFIKLMQNESNATSIAAVAVWDHHTFNFPLLFLSIFKAWDHEHQLLEDQEGHQKPENRTLNILMSSVYLACLNILKLYTWMSFVVPTAHV